MRHKRLLFLSLLIPALCSCSINEIFGKNGENSEPKTNEEGAKEGEEEIHIDNVETSAQSKRGYFNANNISYHVDSDKVIATCHETTDTNQTIDLEFGNISLENGQPKFAKNSYFTFGNAIDSPLNSINKARLKLTVNDSGTNEKFNDYITVAFYWSYHYLTLNNIFNGKYKDLYCDVFITNYFDSSFNTIRYEVNPESCMPRYFLAVFETPNVDLSVSEIEIESEAESAPEAVAFEDFALPTYLNEKQLEVSRMMNLSANGSVDYFGENGIVISFQKTGLLNKFKTRLQELGYVQKEEGFLFKQPEFARSIGFQKPLEDNYYSTLSLNISTFAGFEAIGIYIDDPLTEIEIYDSWPIEKLQASIHNEELKDHLQCPIGETSSNYKFAMYGWPDKDYIDWVIYLEMTNVIPEEIAAFHANARAFYTALKEDARYNTHISQHDVDLVNGHADTYCRADASSETNDLYYGIYITHQWQHVELYFIYSEDI